MLRHLWHVCTGAPYAFGAVVMVVTCILACCVKKSDANQEREDDQTAISGKLHHSLMCILCVISVGLMKYDCEHLPLFSLSAFAMNATKSSHLTARQESNVEQDRYDSQSTLVAHYFSFACKISIRGSTLLTGSMSLTIKLLHILVHLGKHHHIWIMS